MAFAIYGRNNWEVIKPLATTNLITNPSLETNTTNYNAFGSGTTIARSSIAQYFGAYSLQITPGTATNGGTAYISFTLTSGTTYTGSAFVKGENATPYRIVIADSSNSSLAQTTFTGTGNWQRVEVTYTEVSTAARRLLIIKNGSASTTIFYVDGLQVEAQSQASTYCDGDQVDCIWNGTSHGSTSYRSNQTRLGGEIVNLRDDLDLLVRQQPGTGMPPVRNISNELGLQDGSEYQRTLADVRVFSLQGIIQGSSVSDFHNKRKAVINAIKPDSTFQDQPFLLRYTGASGTKQIKVVYDSGLELNPVDQGVLFEPMDIRFVAHDPFWESEGDQGTSLSPNTAIASVSNLLFKSACGEWSKVAGTGLASGVYVVTKGTTGKWYIGHAGNGVSGSECHSMMQWDHITDTFSTMGSGLVEANLAGASTGNATIDAMVVAPTGNLFVAGNFQLIRGATNTIACRIAEWDGSTWQRVREPGSGCPGFVTGGAQAIVFDTYGKLHFSGSFATAGSISSSGIGIWDLTSCRWSTPASKGITGGQGILDAVLGLDGNMYYGGEFTSLGGSTYDRFARFNTSTSTWSTPTTVPGASNFIRNLAVAPDGTIYGGASGNAISSGSDQQIAFNGVNWSGVGQTDLAGAYITGLVIGKKTQNLYGWSVGATSIDGIILPDDFTPVRRTNTTWTTLDVAFSHSIVALNKQIYEDEQGNLLLGFSLTNGTGAASTSSFQVVSADSTTRTKPIMIIKGAGVLFQISNYTTEQTIYFNAYPVQSGEIITIDFNDKTINSTLQGNILQRILPGSNFGTWRLQSGNNNIGVFMTNVTSASVDMYWRNRYWGIDG